jgi:hypothetical protein
MHGYGLPLSKQQTPKSTTRCQPLSQAANQTDQNIMFTYLGNTKCKVLDPISVTELTNRISKRHRRLIDVISSQHTQITVFPDLFAPFKDLDSLPSQTSVQKKI